MPGTGASGPIRYTAGMTEPTRTDEPGEPAAPDPAAARRQERARLRKAADALGWKLVGGEMVEIRVEREVRIGPRTIVLRGRVPVERPEELTEAEGERVLAPLVDPLVAKFRHVAERAAAKILTDPDDVAERRVFAASSFYRALEDARSGLVQAYQELENARVDARVEADLGLRFYLESFTRAARSFEYFAGPTNSGKTYAALELLRAVPSGMYLAPLRLLALEVHERLRELGVATSLVTGEERVIDPAARHVSSTVEMVDLGREVDLAIVDEAQMLQDEQRGWAWTLAVAGVRAKRVVLCGSEDGLIAAERLAARLGATLAVRRFERKNPLTVVESVPLAALRGGDAVVAFSRKAVVDLQGEIRRTGRSTAAIYGSLSPGVRRREAERFRSGEAEVLVATDAIGLGLNLPIRRLIFAAMEKFDGVATRRLAPPEIRQIAGRAGRYGLHERGAVTTLDPRALGLLRAGIDRYDPPPLEMPIWISPTDEHLRRLSTIIGTRRVARLLQFFQTRVRRAGDTDLRIADLADVIEVATALEMSDRFLALPFSVRCTYARAPVNTRGGGLIALALWGERHATQGRVGADDLNAGLAARDRLLQSEDRSRLATLYLWLAQRFPEVYADGDVVLDMRDRVDDEIHDALLRLGERPRRVAPPPAVRRKGPPKFNRKRLPR